MPLTGAEKSRRWRARHPEVNRERKRIYNLTHIAEIRIANKIYRLKRKKEKNGNG